MIITLNNKNYEIEFEVDIPQNATLIHQAVPVSFGPTQLNIYQTDTQIIIAALGEVYNSHPFAINATNLPLTLIVLITQKLYSI